MQIVMRQHMVFYPTRTPFDRVTFAMSPPIKLLYLLVATLPQDGVALALIFSRVPFYEFYTHAPRLGGCIHHTGSRPITSETF